MFFERSVVIERRVDTSIMTLPEEARAASEDGLSENHAYVDVRGQSIEEARDIVNDENLLLQSIEKAEELNQNDILEEVEDALREDMHPLAGFDLGVGGLVLALSSIGCIPISSCNGGVMGDNHPLPHPWIIFYAPMNVIDQLLEASTAANVGLLNNDGGMLELFTGDALSFNKMAEYLTC